MLNFFDEEPTKDLKDQFFDINENFKFGLSVATSEIKNKKQQEAFGREIGKYVIINSPKFITYQTEIVNYTQKIFYDFLKQFFKNNYKKVLVVGIGNEYIESDCFGCLCVNKLKLKDNIFAIKPNVFENTNILSFDIVQAICNQIKPDVIVAIDSLGTRNIKRLTTSFQITNTGVLPGGALNQNNKSISKNNLGIDCVVIGVPAMLFADGLDKNLEKQYKNIILTPKDVRITLDYCSDIVVSCLNKIFD